MKDLEQIVRQDLRMLADDAAGVDARMVDAMSKRAAELSESAKATPIDRAFHYSLFTLSVLVCWLSVYLINWLYGVDAPKEPPTWLIVTAWVNLVFTNFLMLMWWGQKPGARARAGEIAGRMRHQLAELVESDPLVEEASKQIETDEQARALRDAVAARGERLRRFHVEAMKQMAVRHEAERRVLASAAELRHLNSLSSLIQNRAAS